MTFFFFFCIILFKTIVVSQSLLKWKIFNNYVIRNRIMILWHRLLYLKIKSKIAYSAVDMASYKVKCLNCKLRRQKIHLYGPLENRLLKRIFINGIFIFNYRFWRLWNRNTQSITSVWQAAHNNNIVIKVSRLVIKNKTRTYNIVRYSFQISITHSAYTHCTLFMAIKYYIVIINNKHV